ncbi:hypothetical protein LTR25_011051 [Vermiconidia calcicola]|uniref:Uncharacterized protein n=1 Tax=Vermiconidia calcicola TaxID=1690605 RepID=A0AAV9PRL2_9PEZI|nr:hypothetical protein LTR25_011051 [Vermiconidia calcicola]
MALTVGSLLAILSKYEPSTTLDELWTKEDAHNVLASVFDYVKRQTQVKKSSTTTPTIGAKNMEIIRGSEVIIPYDLPRWIANPSSFMTLDSMLQTETSVVTLQHAYELAFALSNNITSSVARLRFLCLLFFDISIAIWPSWINVTDKVINDIAMHLESTQVDKNLLREWIRTGRVFNDFIEEFGEGCLFFLPATVSNEGWQSIQNKVKDAICALKGLGIQQNISEEAGKLGKRIRLELKTPILSRAFQERQSNGFLDTTVTSASTPSPMSSGIVPGALPSQKEKDSRMISARRRSRQASTTSTDSRRIDADGLHHTSGNPQATPSLRFPGNGFLFCLCALLHSLGGQRVPERLLMSGTLPQQRWNSQGNVNTITIRDAGLHDHYVHVFATGHDLMQLLDFCIQEGVVSQTPLEDGSRSFSLCAQAQFSKKLEEEGIMLQGLIFLAHVFPREEALHDS